MFGNFGHMRVGRRVDAENKDTKILLFFRLLRFSRVWLPPVCRLDGAFACWHPGK